MTRKISCNECNKNLGEIRDALLAKGIVYLCSECGKDKHEYIDYENAPFEFLKGKFRST